MIYKSQGQDSGNIHLTHIVGFAGGSDSTGDLGSLPGLGRYPGEGNG